MAKHKINIVRRTGQNYSYYIDKNGILNGEWGGLREEEPYFVNGKKIYWIYYSKFSTYVPIDENGNFYFQFPCTKYDGVVELSDGLFLCEKDNRYGVINNEGNYILHTSFRKILYQKKCFQNLVLDLFIVESETGVFLYNYTNRVESKEYNAIIDYSNEYFLFEENGLYGLIDNDGVVIANAAYGKRKFEYCSKKYLYTKLLGCEFAIYFEKNKLYGTIPIGKYEKCVKLGTLLNGFYITYKKGKYGLLDSRGETIVKPYLNKVYLYGGKLKPYNEINFTNRKPCKNVHIIFIITKKYNKFALYDVVSGECKISNCEEMNFVIGPKKIGPKEDDFICFRKNGEIGYVTTGGFIIDKCHFDDFYLEEDFWIVSKNGKWGVLWFTGFEYLPCIYDDIKRFNRGQYLVHEDGVEKIVGTDFDSIYYEEPEPYYYSSREIMQDTWDAMTDGQYGDMPEGFDGDFDFLGY